MTLPTASYTIQKSRRGADFKLFSNSLIVPFPFLKAADVRVYMENQRLTIGAQYSLSNSVITLHDDNLGLTQSSPLEINFHISRLTEIPNITFTPGAPVKADDLNDWFQVLVMRTEELNALTLSNAWVADTPPPEPWKGMFWVSTSSYRNFVWTGSEWVDIR